MDGIEDTARLILMDLPSRSFAMFTRQLRDYCGSVPLGDCQDLWDKYMGRDGRVLPTHHLETGERIK